MNAFFLGLLKSIFFTPSFESAAIMALQEIGKQLIAKAHLPNEIANIGNVLVNDAGTVLGSIVKNTAAASLVAPAHIDNAAAAIAVQEALDKQ